ncbi:MAG: DUF4397 domain-containing protein [Calditrichaeota bacterium]|nr:MAG: DUF4397 domain-containing protein [Calditrichota bacterium]
MEFGLRFKFMVSLLVLCFAVPVLGQNAQVQFINASADNDVVTEGLQIVIADTDTTAIDFQSATAFLEIAIGTPSIQLLHADTVAFAGTLNLTGGIGVTRYAVVISGVLPGNLGQYDNPHTRELSIATTQVPGIFETAADAAKFEFVFFNAGTDAGLLTLNVDGVAAVTDADFRVASAYAAVDPGAEGLELTTGGEYVAAFAPDFSTYAGQTAVVVASGFIDPTKNAGGKGLFMDAYLVDGTTVSIERLPDPIDPGPWKNMGAANWEFDSVWEDTTVAATHGIAVDADGKVWSGSFGSGTAGIIIRHADGTEAAFSPLATVTVDGVETDLAAGGCRGMAVGKDGHILYEKGALLLKINYLTGEGMASWEGSGSLENPGIDSEGFIYVGKVVGTNPIVVLNGETLAEEQTIELPGAPSFGRGVNVTPDGKTLFAGVLDDVSPLYMWTTEDFVTYSITDSIFANTDAERIFKGGHRTTMNWGPDGRLWVSQDAAYSPDDNSNNALVAFDFDKMEYQRLLMPETQGDLGNGPRNVAFSPDGNTAYAATFNSGVIWKFTKVAATNMQFIHASADQDAGSFDIYMNDNLVVDDLGRMKATAFMEVPSGMVNIKVTPGDDADSTIVAMDAEIAAGGTYVTSLAGVLPINDGKYDNPFSRDLNVNIYKTDGIREAASDPAKFDFVLFHGVTDGEAVDAVADNVVLAGGLDFGAYSDYISVDPGQYDITLTAPGDAADVKALFETDMSDYAGKSAVVFAAGFVEPTVNEGGALLALYAAMADGEVVKWDQTIQLNPGPWKNMGAAAWEYHSVWEDTTVAAAHGVAVDADGKVWSGSFGSGAAGIVIRNANGTEEIFSPLAAVTVDGVEIDLAAGGCRGMAVGKDGHILYEKGAQLIKINYLTGEGMAMWEGSGSLENPGIDSEGFIYVGKVVGTNPVVVLNGETLAEEQTIELPGAPSFGRGVNVTPDGKTLFAGVLDDVSPLYMWTTEDFVTYSITDSIYANTDAEPIFGGGHRTTMNWGPDGRLWVSQDAAYSPDDNSNNSLVAFDFATMEYQRLLMPETQAGLGNGPRNVAFSPDGNTAYAASFNSGVVWKFVKEGTAVAETENTIPERFALGQNYPNPFNPSTIIPFDVAQSGHVELKIFNTMGQVVATLVNGTMEAGKHQVTFNPAKLATGVYFYRVQFDNITLQKRMLFIK